MSEALVVIDGDLVAFRCAAATEKRSVIATNKETLDELEFDTVTKFKEWAGADFDDYELKPVRTPEPIAHTIKGMKMMVDKIISACGTNKYHIVISGEDNFRKEIPLPTQYKDSRKSAGKPVNLALAKAYLVERMNAEVAKGEADEALVAYAYQGYRNKQKVIQATIDKDGYHGPTWLYDWDNMDVPQLIEGLGKLYVNTSDTVKGRGRLFLYYQMLFGDPADCYKPCEIAKVKFGEKSAYKLLKDCTTDKEAVEAIVKQYKKWYPEPVWYEAWDGKKHQKSWLEIWQMYADCAFMPRWDGDRLGVKKLCEKLGVNYE